MLVLSALMLSCSQSDEPEVIPPTQEGMPVVFGGTIDKEKEQTAGTRATDLESVCNTFKVYGYKNTTYDAGTDSYSGLQTVFGGYQVNYAFGSASTSNSHDWEYVNGTTQTIKYWDYAAKAYRFAAFAPATAAVTTQQTADKVTFTVSANAKSSATIATTPYFSKLWFSNNNYPDYTAFGAPVELTFIQPFSRVRIMFIDEVGNAVNTSSIVYQKTTPGSIQFKPADASKSIAINGQMVITYPITGTEKVETYEATAGTASGDKLTSISEPYEETLAFASTAKKWYTTLSIGQQGAYVMSLQYNGYLRTATVPEVYMNWQPGYQYTYVFKLTDKAATFVPELSVYTKWQAGYVNKTQW